MKGSRQFMQNNLLAEMTCSILSADPKPHFLRLKLEKDALKRSFQSTNIASENWETIKFGAKKSELELKLPMKMRHATEPTP